MEAFDGNCEKQLRDTGVDKAASQALSREATSLGLSAWSAISDNHNATRDTNSQQNQLLDFGTGFQRDGGGKAVMMDAMTGKLTTQDHKGNTVEYEAFQDQERMSGKNAMGMASLFMGSPLMLLGMGATMAFLDQSQAGDQAKEADRLRQRFEGAKPAEAQRPQNTRGYIEEAAKLALLGVKDKKLSVHPELSGLTGLGMEFYQNQHLIEKNARKQEQIKERKKKQAGEKHSTMERKKQRRRTSLSIERNNLNSAGLFKARRKLENRMESARGKASLAEVSRMHSELEVLDRAITRLSALGL